MRSARLLTDAAQTMRTQLAWSIAAVICAAYLAVIAPLSLTSLQDYPNHLARALVMSDLLWHHGSRFGSSFELHWLAVPYLLPDLLLAALVTLCGAALAASLYTALVLLSLPCALLVYTHATDAPSPALRPWVFLIGLYLSTDWFFVMGFLAFHLALALIIVGLALAERLRQRWSPTTFAGYLLIASLGYFTHLAVPAFLAAALGASACVRLCMKSTSLAREAALWVPPVALFLCAWQLGVTGSTMSHIVPVAVSWPSLLREKILNLDHEFVGFDWRAVEPLMVLFALALLWPIHRALAVPALKKPRVLECLLVAAMFLVVYFVLPVRTADETYVDIRVLPLVSLFGLFAAVRIPAERVSAIALAALLAVANLAYVGIHMRMDSAWVARYRAVVAEAPSDASVLPVHGQPTQQRVLHVGSFLLLDRGVPTPYLFSADDRDPMAYFRYRRRPYTPSQQWYRESLLSHTAAAVDWTRVACEYDYVLITMPFEAHLIPVARTRVAGNAAAALFALDKRACRRAPS